MARKADTDVDEETRNGLSRRSVLGGAGAAVAAALLGRASKAEAQTGDPMMLGTPNSADATTSLLIDPGSAGPAFDVSATDGPAIVARRGDGNGTGSSISDFPGGATATALLAYRDAPGAIALMGVAGRGITTQTSIDLSVSGIGVLGTSGPIAVTLTAMDAGVVGRVDPDGGSSFGVVGDATRDGVPRAVTFTAGMFGAVGPTNGPGVGVVGLGGDQAAQADFFRAVTMTAAMVGVADSIGVVGAAGERVTSRDYWDGNTTRTWEPNGAALAAGGPGNLTITAVGIYGMADDFGVVAVNGDAIGADFWGNATPTAMLAVSPAVGVIGAAGQRATSGDFWDGVSTRTALDSLRPAGSDGTGGNVTVTAVVGLYGVADDIGVYGVADSLGVFGASGGASVVGHVTVTAGVMGVGNDVGVLGRIGAAEWSGGVVTITAAVVGLSDRGVPGVLGGSSVGVGVRGVSAGDEPAIEAIGPNALSVQGKTKFSRSGAATIAYPNKSATVTVPGGLTATTKVLALIQGDVASTWVRGVVSNPVAGTATILLNRPPGSLKAPRSTVVVWVALD